MDGPRRTGPTFAHGAVVLVCLLAVLLVSSLFGAIFAGPEAAAGGGSSPDSGWPVLAESLIPPGVAATTVLPSVETDPSHHSGDTADDMAIWIHPTDVSLSVVIGDDKGDGGGLMVWGLDGKEIQYIGNSHYNNVDLRYNFPLAGTFSTGESHARVALVAVSDETGQQFDFYKMNPYARRLEAAGSFGVGMVPYGGCMYHSPTTGTYYFIAPDRNGVTKQYELRDGGNGQVAGTLARQFDVGGITEGCVADDVLASLYLAEEDVGIWKYGAEPDAGSTRVQVDKTGSGGNLVADVEGLSIYYAGAYAGFLLASSQGESTVAMYTREGTNTYLAEFSVGANGTIDASSGSDGLDVTNFPLGSGFDLGMFTIHDSSNSGGSASNVKYVRWASIADAFGLAINTTWDPRLVGSGDPLPPPPPPPPTPQCSDGLDNDGDGLIDYPADPGCTGATDDDETNAPPPPPPTPQCSDGLDNDGDGLTDYPADPGCTDANDTDETNAVPPPPPPPPGEIPVSAFRGRYYDNEDLTNQKVERVDSAINFNWGTGSPDPLIGPDTFSVRWEGYWVLSQAGTYRFTATTDDGMRVWVDNASVIDAWIPQSSTTYTKDVDIAAGQHFIQVDFFDRTSYAVAQVSWSFVTEPPGGTPSPMSTLDLAGTRSPSGWYTTPVTVTLTASGGSGAVTILVRLDGAAWTTYAGPVEVGEGRHVLEYYAIDSVGVRETVRSVSLDVDLTPPAFNRAEPSGTVPQSSVEVEWTAVDSTSGVVEYEVSLDGGPFFSVGSSTTLHLTLSDGEHRVAVRAMDGAGNVGTQPVSFRVDTSPFSPTGPYSGIPLFLLIELLAAALVVGALVHRRRKRLRRRWERAEREALALERRRAELRATRGRASSRSTRRT